MVEPFGAGGTMCCATLPRMWRPGIKLQVRTVRWVKRKSEGDAEEIQEEHAVVVPPYVDGKAGELWIVWNRDGTVDAISSDFQPDHPKWPGKVKGWPEPSLEYRRERWEIHMHHEEGGVRLYVALLDELDKEPAKHTREAWESHSKHEPEVLKSYSGPDDPKYAEYLREQYNEGLTYSRQRVQQLKEARP